MKCLNLILLIGFLVALGSCEIMVNDRNLAVTEEEKEGHLRNLQAHGGKGDGYEESYEATLDMYDEDDETTEKDSEESSYDEEESSEESESESEDEKDDDKKGGKGKGRGGRRDGKGRQGRDRKRGQNKGKGGHKRPSYRTRCIRLENGLRRIRHWYNSQKPHGWSNKRLESILRSIPNSHRRKGGNNKGNGKGKGKGNGKGHGKPQNGGK